MSFDDIVNSNLFDLGFNFASYDQSMEIFRTAGADRAPISDSYFHGKEIDSIPVSSEFGSFDYIWRYEIDISNSNLLQRLPEIMGSPYNFIQFYIYDLELLTPVVPPTSLHDFVFEPSFSNPDFAGLLFEGNEYDTQWADLSISYMMVRRAKEPIAIDIDIKPGSDTNCLNTNGHGVIPVAILGSDSFDIANIDQLSLAFGGLDVRIRGKKGPLCNGEYSNGDAYLDLVCHFEDDASAWSPGSEDATLTGTLLDGSAFEGTDSICVVP